MKGVEDLEGKYTQDLQKYWDLSGRCTMEASMRKIAPTWKEAKVR